MTSQQLPKISDDEDQDNSIQPGDDRSEPIDSPAMQNPTAEDEPRHMTAQGQDLVDKVVELDDISDDSGVATEHLTAEDVDLIEKEWVERAKQVVDMTEGDPYKQSIELNKVKADYIKKRYNKAIKLNEE